MGRALARRRHCKHTSDDRLRRRSGYGAALNQAFVGTGNGTLRVTDIRGDSPDGEIWTITLTTATDFGVSGSTLGAQAVGVVGTPYVSDLGEISFLITAGGTPFVNTDAFTLEAVTVQGYQGDLDESDWLKFDENEANRISDINSTVADGVSDAYCAEGDSAQTPLGRSNQFTFEDVQAAVTASDINLD